MERTGRRFLQAFFLFALALLYAAPHGNAASGEMKRQKAPPFTLKLFNGGELKSSEIHGKVVVLKFLASW